MGVILGFIILIGGITLYRTFALYEEKKEFNVLRGRVPNFLLTDLEKAVQQLKKIIHSESKTKTVDDLLTNNEEINKIVSTKEAMQFIIETDILKDAIKNSELYTIDLAKKFLDSTVVSEIEKYNASMPCYLYKYGQNIFGGFSNVIYYGSPAAQNDKSATYSNETGNTYYFNVSFQYSFITASSINKIKTRGYQYLEMHTDFHTNHQNLTGTVYFGLSDNQEINDFQAATSETITSIPKEVIITVPIRDYGRDDYLKIQVMHGGQVAEYSIYLTVYRIALY